MMTVSLTCMVENQINNIQIQGQPVYLVTVLLLLRKLNKMKKKSDFRLLIIDRGIRTLNRNQHPGLQCVDQRWCYKCEISYRRYRSKRSLHSGSALCGPHVLKSRVLL